MSIMKFVNWFRSEPHRAKYGVDHPAFLAAKETWDYQQARIEALEKDYMEEKIEGDRLQARIEALEAENKDLLAACEQKQEIINALKTELKLWLEEDGSPGCKAILRALEGE